MQHQQLQQLLRRAKQKTGKYYLGHEETTGRDSGVKNLTEKDVNSDKGKLKFLN